MNVTPTSDSWSTLSPDNLTTPCDDTCQKDLEITAKFEQVVGIAVPVVFALVVFIGLVGNVLVITVLAATQHIRNSTTSVLVINLALADLIFIVFCVPFTATRYALRSWPFGQAICCLVNYVINVSVYGSVYTLVLMSLDRYLAVVHAVASMTIRTPRNALLAVGVMWLFILCPNIPILLQYTVHEYPYADQSRSICISEWMIPINEKYIPNYAKSFYAVFFVFGFGLPLGTVCLLYGCMLRRLLCVTSTVKNRGKKQRRVTIMITVVILVFAICWLPIQVILLVDFFGNNVYRDYRFRAMMIAANCLAYINSCVNPILYAFLSENIRNGLKSLFRSCCQDCLGLRGRIYTTVRSSTTNSLTLNSLPSRSTLYDVHESERIRC